MPILKIFASFVYSNFFHDSQRSSTVNDCSWVNLDKLTSEMNINIARMSSRDLLMPKKSLEKACVLNIIYSLLEGRLAGSISQAQSWPTG